jgi:hypothetical protein
MGFPYRAREFLNGDSANAAKICVEPDAAFPASNTCRILNPFDRTSMFTVEYSASDTFAFNCKFVALLGFLLVSNIVHHDVLSVRLTNINFGLNPQNTKGPSAEPLPVYEPNLLKPATSEKQ